MTRIRTLLATSILAIGLAAPGGIALAQQSGGGLLGDLFNGGSQRQAQAPQPPSSVGQSGGGSGGAGVDARIDSIENALRQLTGQMEVLQHQNQMLQMQLKRLQDDTDYRFQHGNGGAPPRSAPGQRSQAFPPMQNPSAAAAPPPNQTASSGGHGDAFNPARDPNAPGVPRALGSGQPMPEGGQGMNQGMNNAPIGAPGGREAGQPLDLNALAGPPPGGAAPVDNPAPSASASGGGTPVVTGNMGGGPMGAMGNKLPPPPPRNPSATGAKLATLPPSASPKDEYELAYGYVLHKDYGLATQAFEDFLHRHPKDRLVPDANYWMGESLFQQQKYDDAARAFLTVSTKYKHFSRAPNALLRLGQSLAALHHKEAACATLGEVKNKFPHASSSVKRAVAHELKRVRC